MAMKLTVSWVILATATVTVTTSMSRAVPINQPGAGIRQPGISQPSNAQSSQNDAAPHFLEEEFSSNTGSDFFVRQDQNEHGKLQWSKLLPMPNDERHDPGYTNGCVKLRNHVAVIVDGQPVFDPSMCASDGEKEISPEKSEAAWACKVKGGRLPRDYEWEWLLKVPVVRDTRINDGQLRLMYSAEVYKGKDKGVRAIDAAAQNWYQIRGSMQDDAVTQIMTPPNDLLETALDKLFAAFSTQFNEPPVRRSFSGHVTGAWYWTSTIGHIGDHDNTPRVFMIDQDKSLALALRQEFSLPVRCVRDVQ
jgi:hypothetical protein